jgi:hypothetical protein
VTDLADVVLLLLAVGVLIGILAAWLTWTAGRLDRLHLRLETARASLDTQLARRAGLAAELASCGVLDPASALLLLEASGRTRGETGSERWQAESELTLVLRRVGAPGAETEPLVAELDDAARRAGLARRIHNDLATSTQAMHDRRRVRWFRLAGHATRPALIDFDDRPLA